MEHSQSAFTVTVVIIWRAPNSFQTWTTDSSQGSTCHSLSPYCRYTKSSVFAGPRCMCNPHGSSGAEPTPNMQSRGQRFVERAKKTQHCRQWAGFANSLCFVNSSFREPNMDPWVTRGPGFIYQNSTVYHFSVPGQNTLRRFTLIRIKHLLVMQSAVLYTERPSLV